MTAVLRLGELVAFLLLVVWTLIFPLATLLSLGVTLPLAAVATRHGARVVTPRARTIVPA